MVQWKGGPNPDGGRSLEHPPPLPRSARLQKQPLKSGGREAQTLMGKISKLAANLGFGQENTQLGLRGHPAFHQGPIEIWLGTKALVRSPIIGSGGHPVFGWEPIPNLAVQTKGLVMRVPTVQ